MIGGRAVLQSRRAHSRKETAGRMDRRSFLKTGGAAAAGLCLPLHLAGCGGEPPPPSTGAFAPNAWLRVETDGVVTVLVDRSEMGQGVLTALPMLVAEELDADWTEVRVEQAPANEVYYNPAFEGNQVTGGSTSVRTAWMPLREAGAKARAMLVQAAAGKWGVSPEACRTQAGSVIHPDGSARLGYGELAAAAATLPVPDRVALKDPADFKLIGTPVLRVDAPAMVRGEARYGMDVRMEGLLTAVVARCPVFGGKVAGFDASKALQVAGVRQVVQIDSGVAVVADGYWPAVRGREALEVRWDEGEAAQLDSEALRAQFRELARGDAAQARSEGNVETALADARPVEAQYDLPFLAHATMEPQNCTADVRSDRCTVWAPTQFQTGDPMFAGGGVRRVAMAITGLPRDQVQVHTTHLGGGFGRRLETDYAAEAVQLSKACGAPVKVVWSREDDMQHDVYRPLSYHRMSGGLDQSGNVVAWRHRIVSPSIISRFIPGWLPDLVVHRLAPMKGGVDEGSVEGARDHAYAISNILVEWVKADTPVPVGFWRSVGFSFNVFAVESFVDELAHAAGQDPFAFRRKLLADAPRQRAVLELAAEKARWESPLPGGRFRGIAVARSFQSYVAQVAEVSVQDGAIRVHRVVCAADCGIVINPGTLRAQMEGGIVFGLGAALHGEITLQGGRVQQSNFDDYPVLRMSEAPVIEVHLLPSTEPPTGAGEPGVPPIAPAVANAVFAATGQRIRTLPLRV
jgi:isoquinoline 1-oxidoreductase beta subunit